ncbi:MAG: ABC transporter ATP-binding protein/permease [Streptococcaceae bacterium]|jgi:ATP-binding cassette subfamily B protein AbcA/BmrA|nr:ABC transporter ATP-binding protein/permease [Streptococcaceae bacterium]
MKNRTVFSSKENLRQKQERKKLSYTFFKLIKNARPRYLLFFIGLIMSILSALTNLQIPKLVVPLINNIKNGVDISRVSIVIALYLLIAFLTTLSSISLGIFGEDAVRKLRENLWDKIVHLRIRYFDDVKTGEISSRLVNDTVQIKDFLSNVIPQAISSCLLLVGSIFMMFLLDWHLTLAMIIVVPIGLSVTIPLTFIGKKIGFERQNILAEFQGRVTGYLSEIRLVKASNGETEITQQINHKSKQLYKIGIKEAKLDGIISPIMMLSMMLMMFGVLAYGMKRVVAGQLTVGALTGMMIYLMNLISAVPMLSTLLSSYAKTLGSTLYISNLLEEKQEVLNLGISNNIEYNSLSVENLSFSYVGKKLILKNISFISYLDTVTAFVGPSGSGKSTIFNLLERFYEPSLGEIKIGNIEISKISLANWRKQIGFVSQESAIIDGSIRENLIFGLNKDYDDQKLWEVLNMSFAEEFVKNMPEQLNTKVGERGAKISGGQRQRLAIARAFLRNPKILLLDEATASLDSESEAMVQLALKSLMKGRITLVIAHRLSTIVGADNIYFIENGKITGSGNHSDLLKNHKLYAEYVAEQLTLESVDKNDEFDINLTEPKFYSQ